MSDEHTRLRVFCVRNHVAKSAEEHLACPYCFGREPAVLETGERQRFCDYHAGEDASTFGFPEESTRLTRG